MSFAGRSFYQLIFANLLMALVTLVKFQTLPPQIPLFYSKPPGEDQLTDTWVILILPLLMNLLFFLNSFIFKRYFNHDLFANKVFYFTNLFLIVSFALIFIKIVFLIS